MTNLMNRAVGVGGFGSSKYPRPRVHEPEAPPPAKTALDEIIEKASRSLATPERQEQKVDVAARLLAQVAGVPEDQVGRLRHAEP